MNKQVRIDDVQASHRVALPVGLILGYAVDHLIGDPRRLHPVAGFGQIAGALERKSYAPNRLRGVAFVTLLVAGSLSAGMVLTRVKAQLPAAARPLVIAVVTWAVLGGRSLGREAELVEHHLTEGDLDAARNQVRNLVGRDTRHLSADEVARATVESLAENSSDAVVAPLVWGAVGGLPGLIGYRAVNTLDAMVGHQSQRYCEFGWAAARFDDIANLIPARVTVALTTLDLCARNRSLSPIGSILRVVRRDAPAHPSPNAGPIEATWAVALGVQLGGRNTYEAQTEDRGVLGEGRPVAVQDIPAARRLLDRVGLASLLLAVIVSSRRGR